MNQVTEGTIRSTRRAQVPWIAFLARMQLASRLNTPLTTMPDRYAPAHIAP